MSTEHEAQPDGNWDDDGAGHCAVCAGRLIEAVYTGGWLHANESPHGFAVFVYSDGTRQQNGGCLDCGRLKGHLLHEG